jgi:hypothetical protein
MTLMHRNGVIWSRLNLDNPKAVEIARRDLSAICRAVGVLTPGDSSELHDLPLVLEHLAALYPRHVQIHYGKYKREELYDAARRSRACACLADDDHGPLALQEILLAGCPTVGVPTGAPFVEHGDTGVVLDRLPPGQQCVESDDDVRALAVFMEAIEQAKAMDRPSVRDRAAEEFDSDRIVDSIITAVNTDRLGGGIERAANV